jgi:hypothetical protein
MALFVRLILALLLLVQPMAGAVGQDCAAMPERRIGQTTLPEACCCCKPGRTPAASCGCLASHQEEPKAPARSLKAESSPPVSLPVLIGTRPLPVAAAVPLPSSSPAPVTSASHSVQSLLCVWLM